MHAGFVKPFSISIFVWFFSRSHHFIDCLLLALIPCLYCLLLRVSKYTMLSPQYCTLFLSTLCLLALLSVIVCTGIEDVAYFQHVE